MKTFRGTTVSLIEDDGSIYIVTEDHYGMKWKEQLSGKDLADLIEYLQERQLEIIKGE